MLTTSFAARPLLTSTEPSMAFTSECSGVSDTEPLKPSQFSKNQGRKDLISMTHSNPPSLPTGRVVLLNGFPGVGKYSVGRSLFNMFDHKHARYIDNHLLIDPVEAIVPGRGPEHKELHRAFREVAFDALCNTVDKSTTLIFTRCLSSTEEDQHVFEEYLALASRRQVSFFLFNISCNSVEHHSRLVKTERVKGSKTKLVIPEVLNNMLHEHKLVKLDYGQTSLTHTAANYMFKLDTTYNSIDESALKIYNIVTGCVAFDSPGTQAV
jgi:chloramphenicol 3-O-phosphotransferase